MPKITQRNVKRLTPTSAAAKYFYENQSKIIAEKINIASVISQHNTGLSDDDFA